MALIIVLASTILILSFHLFYLNVYNLSLKVRVAVSSLVYKKVLTLQKQHFQKVTTGQIINLLSNDINRIDLSLLALHYIWFVPLKIVVATVYLNIMFGFSSTFGIVGIVAFVLIQCKNAHKNR